MNEEYIDQYEALCEKHNIDKPSNSPNLIIDDDGKNKSQSTLLIDIGKQGVLYHDDNGDGYTDVDLNGVTASMKIRSSEYREYLSKRLYELIEKGGNATAMTEAITTLEAIAKFQGTLEIIALRVYKEKNVFIDLGGKDRKVLAVSAEGFITINNPPVKFIRKPGMTEQSIPISGDISLLRQYLNINDHEYTLIVGWLLCALAGVSPYPILVLQGEQGSGKSTISKLLRSLVDPSSVPLRTPPRQIKDLQVSASNNHVVVLDNLSGVKPDIADALCRLSTGAGMDYRSLYTNDEQIIIQLTKPIIINGIDEIATRPDLASRSLIVTAQYILDSNRQDEEAFWKSFNNDKPSILGGLLKLISNGLSNNHIRPDKLPRIADAAKWINACEYGTEYAGQFLKSYEKNESQAIQSGIESSPVGTAIITLMSNRKAWTGSPTALLDALTDIAGERQTRSRSWIQSTKGLSNAIKRLTPNFRKAGIEISQNRQGGTGNRLYVLENTEKQTSQMSQASQSAPVKKAFVTDVADVTLKNTDSLTHDCSLKTIRL